MASAPAVTSGLPPKVEMDAAGSESMISARATTPPIDRPLPMPLANVIMSGTTPCASMPQKCSPVRPQPVCTSSAMNRMPYSSVTALSAP